MKTISNLRSTYVSDERCFYKVWQILASTTIRLNEAQAIFHAPLRRGKIAMYHYRTTTNIISGLSLALKALNIDKAFDLGAY